MKRMRRGRSLKPLIVSKEQRATLESWVRRRTSAQALAQRARIVLACGEGHNNTTVADLENCSLPTVGKWRERFLARGVDGLLDEPRPGQPRKITDAKVEEVITRTLASKPKAATHWSTRSMAKVITRTLASKPKAATHW